MPPTDESLPLDQTAPDESDASISDEEMAEEPEEEADDADLEPAPADDGADDGEADEDEEEEGDGDTAALRRRLAELEEATRRAEYERQQAANQAYWNDLERQAVAAFEYEERQIWENKDNYVDPDAYVRQEMGKLQARVTDWYRRFFHSQNESRAAQYERAAIPAYAARLAAHHGLSEKDAAELLDYPVELMPKVAARMARDAAKIAALRKNRQQAQRATARSTDPRLAVPAPGGGRATKRGVKAGSLDHLKEIFAGA